MKSWLIAGLMLCSGPLFAAEAQYPQVATTTGAVYSVSVTSNPGILVSTGAFRPEYKWNGAYVPPAYSTNATRGQFMSPRIAEEIFNDSGQTIYIGYDSRVSSQTGANLGHKLPHGASMSFDDAIPKWAIAETSTTAQRIIITQEW